MFKNLYLASVIAAISLTPAYASHWGDNNNNAAPARQASPEVQAYNEASIQLNLDVVAARHVFTVAERLQKTLPTGIVAAYGTNTPHVTLEIFKPTTGGNLTTEQLAFLKEKLGQVHGAIRKGFKDQTISIQAVPNGLKLIAKFTGQDNQYYTIENIGELKSHKGELTECFLTYVCDIRKEFQTHHRGQNYVESYEDVFNGTAYLKGLQNTLHSGVNVQQLKPSPFADNPLCHVTLMRWTVNANKVEVADFCTQLFRTENAHEGKIFSCDRLVLNPAFADNGFNGRAPNFEVGNKLHNRGKVDWNQSPRASFALTALDKLEPIVFDDEAQPQQPAIQARISVDEINAKIAEKQGQIGTHVDCMNRTQNCINATNKRISDLDSLMRKHAGCIQQTSENIKKGYRVAEKNLGMTLEKKLEEQKRQNLDYQAQRARAGEDLNGHMTRLNTQKADLARMQAELQALDENKRG